MTLILDLAPDLEHRLNEQSAKLGVDPAECARRLIDNALPSKRHPISMAIDRWNDEDNTNDPEELARREAEWEEFRQAMNESHTSSGPVYP